MSCSRRQSAAEPADPYVWMVDDRITGAGFAAHGSCDSSGTRCVRATAEFGFNERDRRPVGRLGRHRIEAIGRAEISLGQ